MDQFRPISLCQVLYKIVAKALANRLRSLLDKCNDETQSAFVPGISISDNVLIAYELMHSMKVRKRGLKGSFALKLDMAKAYDRLNWDFLEKVMLQMGFDSGWVSLILRCISSVTYSVNFNGRLSETFSPTRGVRQGDPLSPYLFLFCAEGLSSLLHNARVSRLITGAKTGRSGIPISHLFFADDSILFGSSTIEDATRLREIVSYYERASGQLVNYNKSAIFFSGNVSQSLTNSISNLFNVRVSVNPEKYLGLPNLIGRNKKAAFASLTDKMNKKTDSWSTRFLSMGGKEVFIKLVLQAIPIYAMQCFLFPKTLCASLEQIMNRFWWRNNSSKKGIHWTSWSSICLPKKLGGMGFRDLAKFNIALLAKQGWNLINNPTCLLARVLKAKYYPNDDFMTARLGTYPSYTWKSIWCSRGLLEKGLGWRVGNGISINIWQDAWVAGPGNGKISPPATQQDICRVADLINSESYTWKTDLIKERFAPPTAHNIICMPLPLISTPDRRFWRGDSSGLYSVRSGYRWLVNSSLGLNGNPTDFVDDWYTKFCGSYWSLPIPTKIRVFFWRFAHNLLPTYQNLISRKIQIHGQCILCHSGLESVFHMAYECHFIKQVLNAFAIIVPTVTNESSFLQWLATLFESLSATQKRCMVIIFWAIWSSRNKVIHEGSSQSVSTIVAFAKSYILELDGLKPCAPIVPKVRNSIWNPPNEGIIKVNFDSSFSTSDSKSVSGVIFRNTEGLVMAAGIYPHLNVYNVEHAEALACESAVLLGHELGFQKLAMEGDSSVVISNLISPTNNISLLCHLYRNIKHRKSFFEYMTFTHVNRERNQAAHRLAQLGLSSTEPCIWIEEVPAVIEATVLRDKQWCSVP
ncbi:hypothetical protein HRI_002355200 [Hibiscus trionum]|uniref:Reverse transcriptase domain-containing protein n=1 Tax=Hibiscus trionum TaxID=183268 RepID=A0A9W7I055_HIBTR|nr:hypothetical protein HRI_002355200 [Hibiscus trionum]